MKDAAIFSGLGHCRVERDFSCRFGLGEPRTPGSSETPGRIRDQRSTLQCDRREKRERTVTIQVVKILPQENVSTLRAPKSPLGPDIGSRRSWRSHKHEKVEGALRSEQGQGWPQC
jgi:hypothetical protein